MSIDTKPHEEAVKHPGKFEGQPAWVPYFWELVCNGDGESFWENDDTEGQEFIIFEPLVEETEAFGIDDIVVVWEDSQGFVCGRTFDTREDTIKWATT